MGPVEEKRDVAAQMDDAVARNLGIAGSLGENATSYGVPLEGAGIVGDGDLRWCCDGGLLPAIEVPAVPGPGHGPTPLV
jgi:hypothetical protein